MKYNHFNIFIVIISFVILASCNLLESKTRNLRPLVDTVGFAQYGWQLDTILARIDRQQGDYLENMVNPVNGKVKVLISPHDDYSYVGYLYPATFRNVKAKTIFLFGVAHKAKQLNLENKIVFGNYKFWKGPDGPVPVSLIRNEIVAELPNNEYIVNDSMQEIEHSIEALIPWIQHYKSNIEIIPILIPYMSYDRMQELSRSLAKEIQTVITNRKLRWGEDFIFVISTDAVHYGDEDWGGKNFALYGTDSSGYDQAIHHEHEIINTITGELNPEKIKSFCNYTVDENNYKEYKWTWCGRYSVPFGLLTAYWLNENQIAKKLNGTLIGYATSIDHPHIRVNDIGMGVTAPANEHHWVGYTAIYYK